VAGADTFQWDWTDRLTNSTSGGQATTYAHAGDEVGANKSSGGATTPCLWDREAGLPLPTSDASQSYVHADGVLAGIDGAGALAGGADYDDFGAIRAQSGAGGAFGFAG